MDLHSTRPPARSGAVAAARAGSGIAARAARIAGVEGWRRSALAMLAGAMSVLAMAPFFLWPVLAVTLPVLLWLIDGAGDRPRSLRSAFAAGWAFGFGYFFAGLFWIGEAFLVEAEIFAWLLPFAITLMPAGLALFWGAAAASARMWWPRGWPRILVLAVALAVAEWLRGHVLTGFPWNVLGYALTFDLTTMQLAAVLGIFGLTLWTVVAFAAPLVVAADLGPRVGDTRALGRGAAVPLAVVLALSAYGSWSLRGATPAMVPGVTLRIVQPSIPQRDKWRPEKQREIFETHLRLSGTRPDGTRDDLSGVSHVVWPEAAMPFMPLSTPEALAAIGEMLPDGTQLLTGALRIEPADRPGAPRRAYNSLMVFDDTGRLAALYDKIHLVPFGEYLPFQALLESIGLQQLTRLRGGFTPGSAPRPLLDVPGLPKVGGLVCYEAIFPGAVVQGGERPGLLVNVTNDGWFGNTTGPRQHFHQARVRAVEEGLPLVRVANNGISALIGPDGRVLARIGLDRAGVADAALPAALPPTLYSRAGDVVFWVNALLFLLLAGWLRPRAIVTKS